MFFPWVQVILEGMGRSLHTNYNAKFKCDALKVRIIAVTWNILKTVSAIFLYGSNEYQMELHKYLPLKIKFD